MMRIGLIAAGVLLLLAGIGAGAAFYLKPELFASAKEETPKSQHAEVSYAKEPEAQEATRKHILTLVEQLGAVQDRIIRGDRSALPEQGRLLTDIAGVVRRFDAQDWHDYINVRASFVYVLSGGDPRILKPYVDSDEADEANKKLAQGIMKFAEGQSKTARKLFHDIDPRSLDVSLVAPFALARASLYLDDDGAKAITILDEARLASPHTAIEEAAARREIPLLISTGDTHRGMILAVDYVRRFGKSIYARKMFRDFAEALTKRSDLDEAATIDGLVAAIEGIDGQIETDLLLDVAGESLVRGKLAMAKTASSHALSIGKGAPEDLEKARLYEAAAEAPSGHAADALKALEQIAADQLSDDDTEIRGVAGYLARAVTGTELANKNAGEEVIPSPPDLGEPHKNADPSAVTSALESADAAMKEADLIIARTKK